MKKFEHTGSIKVFLQSWCFDLKKTVEKGEITKFLFRIYSQVNIKKFNLHLTEMSLFKSL